MSKISIIYGAIGPYRFTLKFFVFLAYTLPGIGGFENNVAQMFKMRQKDVYLNQNSNAIIYGAIVPCCLT